MMSNIHHSLCAIRLLHTSDASLSSTSNVAFPNDDDDDDAAMPAEEHFHNVFVLFNAIRTSNRFAIAISRTATAITQPIVNSSSHCLALSARAQSLNRLNSSESCNAL